MNNFENEQRTVLQPMDTITEETPIQKLEKEIEAEKNSQKDIFVVIGEKYCEKYKNNYDEDFSVEMLEFKNSEDKIAKFKKEILTIKGVALCEACGAEIPLNSIFCNICGTKVGTVKAEPVKVEEPAPFVNPFSNLATEEPVVEEVKEQPKPFINPFANLAKKEPKPFVNPFAPVQTASDKIICENCSSEMDSSLKFCTNCGTMLKKEQAPVDTNNGMKKCVRCGEMIRNEAMFCTNCGNKF